MTQENNQQPQPSAGEPSIRFVELSPAVMTALAEGDLATARADAGVPLTDYFVTDEARWLWRFRLGQLAADPASARWFARAVVNDSGEVVGHAGFHGPANAAGTAEIAYSVDPAYRRRGYARAMLRGLLRRAAEEPTVRTVRATISPDNVASLATIAGFGFVYVGEQWDEEDGRELIFEIPADRHPGS
ncbi:GNAT family protein [Micromonospora sp. NPDC049559]|uniref:GNAT family N-acetyltransferase n=1 Tax=Micromonospora sp. NPDC049559 TaxID=3155923 RepID=UPI00341F46BD